MVGLDFGAVLTFAAAQGADTPLLAEMLPILEPLVLRAYRKEDDDGNDR